MLTILADRLTGRTAAFEAVNLGSTPSLLAIGVPQRYREGERAIAVYGIIVQWQNVGLSIRLSEFDSPWSRNRVSARLNPARADAIYGDLGVMVARSVVNRLERDRNPHFPHCRDGQGFGTVKLIGDFRLCVNP